MLCLCVFCLCAFVSQQSRRPSCYLWLHSIDNYYKCTECHLKDAIRLLSKRLLSRRLSFKRLSFKTLSSKKLASKTSSYKTLSSNTLYSKTLSSQPPKWRSIISRASLQIFQTATSDELFYIISIEGNLAISFSNWIWFSPYLSRIQSALYWF